MLESLPERLKISIAQKEILDVEEVAEFSDKFFEAQKNNRASQERNSPGSRNSQDKNKTQDSRKTPMSSKRHESKKEIRCFVCQSTKHIAKHCPSRATASAAVETVAANPKKTAPAPEIAPAEPTEQNFEEFNPRYDTDNSQGYPRKTDYNNRRKGNK